MLTINTVIEQLTSSHIMNAFVQQMLKESTDFALDYQRYTAALDSLQKELGDQVTDEIRAIEQQFNSDLLFSGWLGLKANLDNFIDPMARNFLDVDFEIYLREETAHSLPEYRRAQEVRNRFYAQLTLEQKKTYEAVITYTSTLETMYPKLAHYYGFLLGNELLPRLIPGYHKDSVLTMRYTTMLNQYFEKPILHTVPFSA